MSTTQNPQIKATAPDSLCIGQKVRHQDDYKGQRVVGKVRMLCIEDGALKVEIALDEPIVIPERDGYPEVRIHRQYVPAHEVHVYDERDEVIDGLLTALKDLRRAYVNLLETGRDRILFLGGECDPLDKMVEGDPYLRAAVDAIAKAGGTL
ncbi:hypothetical protein [Rhodoferax sp. GW822-FHT02A01]|uniref:hypothetical protein n=1 Tax=Rhodoferax sp. GW822-FHT02A01 TaxID=3141537 RepID=UPI00315CBEAB